MLTRLLVGAAAIGRLAIEKGRIARSDVVVLFASRSDMPEA